MNTGTAPQGSHSIGQDAHHAREARGTAMAQLLGASGHSQKIMVGVAVAVALFGTAMVLWLEPGKRPVLTSALWCAYAAAVVLLAWAPTRWRPWALMVNGLLLQACVVAVAGLQGWGLNGGSLFFLPAAMAVLAMALPVGWAAWLWLQGMVGIAALAAWHHAHLATGAALAVSEVPLGLKTGLLMAAHSLALLLGMVMGKLVQQQMAREADHKARYRDFFQQVPIAVIVHRHGTVIDANQAAAVLLGFANREDMCGQDLAATAADAETARALRERIVELEKLPVGEQLAPARVRLVSRSGRQLDCQTTCSRVSLPDGPANIAMLTDETLRIAMEASLRWSLSLQQQLVASSPLAIGITHIASGRTINTNDAAAQLTGYSVSDLVSWDQNGLDQLWPDVNQVRLINEDLASRGVSAARDLTLRTRTGDLRTVRIWASAFDVDDEEYAVWFGQDITLQETERAERESMMERARSEAEAASRSKTAFLANTSHELRTPLNAVIGLSQLALAPGVSEAQRLKYLQQINDSSRALSNIVSEVLDLAKIEAGGFELERVPFDLRELIGQLEATYQTLAEGKGLGFESITSWRGSNWVLGDPTRVRQIAQNLLGNALKFTDNGRIRLTVRRLSRTHVCIEVLDTGPGVPIEAQEFIFKPFAQADSSTTRRYGGTGLGLSIVSEICELMGGMCEVSSTPGQGSRFWCVIELQETMAPATAAPAGQAPEINVLAGRRILVVEDNPVNRMIITLMLEQQGAQVMTSNDGQQALDALDQLANEGQLPDAVLMDMQMPDMDGKTATRALRARTALAHLPVIALTAGVTTQERDDALASGVDDYLTKPIELAALTRRLSDLFERSRGSPASVSASGYPASVTHAWPPA